MLVVLALALTGTLLAFWLFAWAQARVPAALAGAFVNLEPLVGALTGAVVFHDAIGAPQLAGRDGDPGRHRARRATAGAATRRHRHNADRGRVHFGTRAPLTAARVPKCTATLSSS